MTAPHLRKVPDTAPLSLPEITAEQSRSMTFEFARFVNQNSTEYIRQADYKAAILVTLLSANLLVLVQRGGTYIADGYTAWRLLLVVFACVYAATSLAIVVNTIRPRLFRNAAKGHVFWEDISAMDKDAYARSFATLAYDDMILELGEHNHNLARSAIRKYRWLRVGFFMALTSIALSAAIILWTSH